MQNEICRFAGELETKTNVKLGLVRRTGASNKNLFMPTEPTANSDGKKCLASALTEF